MNIVILGTGMVGSAMVRDLAQEKNFILHAVDVNQKNLKMRYLQKVQIQ